MVVGGALIWLDVVGLLVHAGRRRETPWSAEKAGRLIAWGGVAFLLVVLLALLAYVVWLMPAIRPWLARVAAAAETI